RSLLRAGAECDRLGSPPALPAGGFAPALFAGGMEGRPRDAPVVVGHADLIHGEAQFFHAHGHEPIEWLGVSLGEIPGMLGRVVPHGPLGRRRADHRGLAKEGTEAPEAIAHAGTIGRRVKPTGIQAVRARSSRATKSACSAEFKPCWRTSWTVSFSPRTKAFGSSQRPGKTVLRRIPSAEGGISSKRPS